MYKELEESGEYDDLLKGIDHCSITIGKKEARYTVDGANKLKVYAGFDFEHADTTPGIFFNFNQFNLGLN